MLWTRLARHYAVNRDLGPKLIMIQLMVKDIIVFLGLMVLVFAGYSVALYSILQENSEWREHTFTEMVFMPYFPIYGELFLEEMREQTNCTNPEFTDCSGDPGWFAAPLLAGYIMVANILLVNLLIAMMSSTYEAVESRALELWAYQNLDALVEARNSWILPAPFNVVRNLYLVCRWCVRKSRDVRRRLRLSTARATLLSVSSTSSGRARPRSRRKQATSLKSFGPRLRTRRSMSACLRL